MTELTLSITPTDAVEATALQHVLDEFQAQTHISVRLHEIDTKFARDEINKFPMAGKGPDVSQVGSTWLRGIVDMNVLRPFTTYETARMGKPADFIEASWKSTFLPGYPNVQWAIPWLADVRMIYYRKDLLKNAGINEQGAFANPQAFEKTLLQLQSSGVQIPWVVPSQHSWRTLHNIASWVWGFGGDFVDSTGKQMLFDRPEAMAGFQAYFALERFLAGPARGLTTAQSDALFVEGQAAVTISGTHLLSMPPEMLDKVGFTSPPGSPFVGGSHLVIWKYSHHEREAVQLVEALTSAEFQKSYGLGSLLPVRLDALNHLGALAGHNDTFEHYIRNALAQGRSFHSAYLWDIVEARLVSAMETIWKEILESPEPDVHLIVERVLHSLARRLTLIFEG